MMMKSIAFILVALVFTACHKRVRLFEKLDAQAAGIVFENKLSPTADFNIIDYLYFYNGGGVAIGDINGDQLPDIYFSGNQVPNRLFLNKGDLKFEDITKKAGVEGNSTWNTGAVMGDVNGDGLLDIYVCAVVGLKHLRGHNELYINNGDNTFSERAAEYGLDFDTYSSSAAFLDYDRDGDLDIYLLNHAVHTAGSFGHASLRNKRSYASGDRLLRNDGSTFVDVSEAAGIYGGIIGYGLGIAISDFNLDGYPDIFVGNDFHEDDYLYMNNTDGTFREVGKEAFTCTSKFSMGNDVADINHDGLPDLMTLDMLAQDETVLKSSEGDDNVNIMRMRTNDYGYNYQFVRNMMQINEGNGKFSETALMSNVAATDWSWSALFADFDQDSNQDLFVSNGIPRRPNDLDYIKYVSNDKIVNTIETTKLVDERALSLMPSGMVANFIFKGSGSYSFEDKSDQWLPAEKTCSTASALADLDNDGDLDIVVNNVDASPGIYINQTNTSANYLKIGFRFSKPNPFGIGARVTSYHNGIQQMKELYTVRGFQASSEPMIHFGYGDAKMVDSIIVVWPDGKKQILRHVATNQALTISPESGTDIDAGNERTNTAQWFERTDPKALGLDFRHVEDAYTDFNRLKLLPYQQSDRGPATAVGDIDNDGLADIYFGGSKHIPGQLYIQSAAGFVRSYIAPLLKDSVKEDIDAVIADLSGDGNNDLFIATGGADFYHRSKPLLDVYYTYTDSAYEAKEVPDYYENASCLIETDIDGDGDADLFVGNESVSNDFGAVPRSSLLVNDHGEFSPAQKELFDHLGMVTDAVFDDYDRDGDPDLVVVGEWMQPAFLRNDNGVFVKDNVTDQKLRGLWQSISAFDIDADGDTDYILGNWGLNARFKASVDHPMRMYYSDFDSNGQSETIIAIEKNGKYYTLDNLDVLASQLPSLRKTFNSYHSFAGKTVEEVFGQQQLKMAKLYEVDFLCSGYLRNDDGRFQFVELPMSLQTAPIMAQLKFDFDSDGKTEVLLAGNYFGVQPFHGRYGSFPGAIVTQGGNVIAGNAAGLDLINHSVRHLNVISFKGDRYLLITVNDGAVQIYKVLTE